MIVAIDPGTRHLGWAVSDLAGRALRYSGCSDAPTALDLDAAAALHATTIQRAVGLVERASGGGAYPRPLVFLESMRYARDRATTPQTLLDVQTVGCLTAATVGPVRLVPPERWKGSTPKMIFHERMIGALDEIERGFLRIALLNTRASNHKEVLDAVGIFLYSVDRVDSAGTPR